MRYSAKTWLNFSVRLDYQLGQQPFFESDRNYFQYQGIIIPVPVYSTEHFNRVGFNPGVNYQLTKKISAGLYYTHWTRDSNFSQNRYTDDTVSSFSCNTTF